ncbi:MAG TPA: right-handed parallel beta-helix repeat-containing protein [Chloroflexia bacterium]|nr:right-handed parallel beta-helix repeat-containing protein [Chloroflexia bacterium]
MLHRAASYYPLALTVLFGLVLSLIPTGPVLGDNIGACQGNTASSTKLTLGGRVITPSQILLASGTQTCATGETSLNLVSLSHTIIVSPDGTPTENGTALLTAMTTISNSNPSASNPWLLKLEPGSYDLGSQSLTLKSYVDLEGSGEDTTTISSTVASGAFPPTAATLMAASNSEIRNLKVTNTSNAAVLLPAQAINVKLTHLTTSATNSGSGDTFGLVAINGSTFTVKDSTLSGSAGSPDNIGMLSYGGTGTVQNSTMTGNGGSISIGLYILNSGVVTVQNSTMTASNATNAYGATNGGTLTVQNSFLTSSGSVSSYGLAGAGTSRISGSELAGSTGTLNGNNATCVASYNASFTTLGSNCQ